MQKQVAAAWAVAGTAIAVAVIVVTGSTVGLFGARSTDNAAISVVDAGAQGLTRAAVASGATAPPPQPANTFAVPALAGTSVQPATSTFQEQSLAQAGAPIAEPPIAGPRDSSDGNAYLVEQRDHDDDDEGEHEEVGHHDREHGDRDGWSLLSLVRGRHDD